MNTGVAKAMSLSMPSRADVKTQMAERLGSFLGFLFAVVVGKAVNNKLKK